MGDRGAQFSHGGDAGYMSEFRLRVAQRFFGALPFGDVHHGPDIFNEIARWTENGMTYGVDVPDLAAGMNEPVIHLVIHLLTACCLDYFPDPGLIIRMDALQVYFE